MRKDAALFVRLHMMDVLVTRDAGKKTGYLDIFNSEKCARNGMHRQFACFPPFGAVLLRPART
jgi:hypothetical protein